MQPSNEKIIETVREVMSQRQFQFKDPFEGFNFPFFAELGYFLLFSILCGCFVFLFLIIRNMSRHSEKKDQQSLIKAENPSPSVEGSPIEKLHAAFLNCLENRQIVKTKKWKTNGDYIDESGNPIFQKVCVLYDAVIYGAKNVSDTSVSLLDQEFKAWEHQRESNEKKPV